MPKYAELTGMLYGALSERTKKAQSDSFPQRYHIRTSLVGKFLIYAVIFLRFGTGKPLISRCHWILQRSPPRFALLPNWLAANAPSTNNADKVREQGFTTLSGQLAKEVTQEIPNKTLPVHCATALFVCLMVFWRSPFSAGVRTYKAVYPPLLSAFWNTGGDI